MAMVLFRTALIAVLVVVDVVYCIPVDNGLTADPEISCEPTSIAVAFATQKSFSGHVYVKGKYSEEGCRISGDGSVSTASITLSFDACGVRRTRSLNPKGVEVIVTVVISFHPLFVTKVDRALQVKCFYMEADKTVSTELEVSMLTTELVSAQLPMPICRYDILQESPTGDKISFAEVGQKTYHKWTCTTPHEDTFCMVVHSCFVQDDAGDRHNILDENGCAVDPVVLGNLDYMSDLMAGREAHAFKFHDKTRLQFDCQISVLVKEPNTQCPRPTCPEAAARLQLLQVAALRQRRSDDSSFGAQCSRPWANCADVVSQVDVIDIDARSQSEQFQDWSNSRRRENHHSRNAVDAQQPTNKQYQRKPEKQYCLHNGHLSGILVTLCLLSIVMTASIYYAVARSRPGTSAAAEERRLTVVHVVENAPAMPIDDGEEKVVVVREKLTKYEKN